MTKPARSRGTPGRTGSTSPAAPTTSKVQPAAVRHRRPDGCVLHTLTDSVIAHPFRTVSRGGAAPSSPAGQQSATGCLPALNVGRVDSNHVNRTVAGFLKVVQRVDLGVDQVRLPVHSIHRFAKIFCAITTRSFFQHHDGGLH